MAAIAFDTLKFARRLIEAGVPEQQAEVQGELMAEAFVFNMDSLVTRDYLDARIDARFAEQDARNDVRFTEIHGQLKLHTWILGAVAASTVLPFLHSLFSF